jgi:hypothetical protein
MEPAAHVELEIERELLVKAERDIERGRLRLQRQQQTVAELRACGRNTKEAERLVELTSKTLIEWERHRSLIEQRILCLKGRPSG